MRVDKDDLMVITQFNMPIIINSCHTALFLGGAGVDLVDGLLEQGYKKIFIIYDCNLSEKLSKKFDERVRFITKNEDEFDAKRSLLKDSKNLDRRIGGHLVYIINAIYNVIEGAEAEEKGLKPIFLNIGTIGRSILQDKQIAQYIEIPKALNRNSYTTNDLKVLVDNFINKINKLFLEKERIATTLRAKLASNPSLSTPIPVALHQEVTASQESIITPNMYLLNQVISQQFRILVSLCYTTEKYKELLVIGKGEEEFCNMITKQYIEKVLGGLQELNDCGWFDEANGRCLEFVDTEDDKIKELITTITKSLFFYNQLKQEFRCFRKSFNILFFNNFIDHILLPELKKFSLLEFHQKTADLGYVLYNNVDLQVTFSVDSIKCLLNSPLTFIQATRQDTSIDQESEAANILKDMKRGDASEKVSFVASTAGHEKRKYTEVVQGQINPETSGRKKKRQRRTEQVEEERGNESSGCPSINKG